jgi:hypothetical protein
MIFLEMSYAVAVTATSGICVIPSAFLMLILVSFKTKVWIRQLDDPREPFEKNRDRARETLHEFGWQSMHLFMDLQHSVMGLFQHDNSDQRDWRAHAREAANLRRKEMIEAIPKSRKSRDSFTFNDVSTSGNETVSTVEEVDIAGNKQDVRKRKYSTRIINWFEEFANGEYSPEHFPSISFSARKGYPWLMLIIISFVGSAVGGVCILTLDLSWHTLVFAILVLFFCNLIAIITLRISALAHYLLSIFGFTSNLLLALSTLIDLWESSLWQRRIVLLAFNIIFFILTYLLFKSFVFEWILVMLFITWPSIIVLI